MTKELIFQLNLFDSHTIKHFNSKKKMFSL
jgi:hypothetical protein